METKKLTTEELNSLKEFQTTQEQITYSLGQIELQSQILKSQKENVLSQLTQLQDKKSKVADQLQEKYGDGNINIDTGEFTNNV